MQLARKGHLGGLGVDDRELAQGSVLQELHRAPVRVSGDSQAGHPGQRLVVVHRGGQDGGGVCQELQPSLMLGALRFRLQPQDRLWAHIGQDR